MDAIAQSEGAPRTISAVTAHAQDIDRAVRNGWVMNGGVLELFFTSASAFSATVTPNPTDGFAHDYSDLSATSSVTVTPSGGQAPYSYSCVVTSFSGRLPTIAASSSATTVFFQNGLSTGDLNDCVFTWTVTDALGSTATVPVSVTFHGPLAGGRSPI